MAAHPEASTRGPDPLLVDAAEARLLVEARELLVRVDALLTAGITASQHLATRVAEANADRVVSSVADQLLIDASEAARLLRLSRSVFGTLYRSGRIPTVRIGGLVRFSPVDLRTWVATQREGAVS